MEHLFSRAPAMEEDFKTSVDVLLLSPPAFIVASAFAAESMEEEVTSTDVTLNWLSPAFIVAIAAPMKAMRAAAASGAVLPPSPAQAHPAAATWPRPPPPRR